MSRRKHTNRRKRVKVSSLQRATHPVELCQDLLMAAGANCSIESPDRWLYIPDRMINWDEDPGLKWLPPLAAYDEISTNKMWSRLKVGLDADSFDVRQAAAIYYPYNIDDGYPKKARSMSILDVLSWKRRYKARVNREEEVPDMMPSDAEMRGMRDILHKPHASKSLQELEIEEIEDKIRVDVAQWNAEHDIASDTYSPTNFSPPPDFWPTSTPSMINNLRNAEKEDIMEVSTNMAPTKDEEMVREASIPGLAEVDRQQELYQAAQGRPHIPHTSMPWNN